MCVCVCVCVCACVRAYVFSMYACNKNAGGAVGLNGIQTRGASVFRPAFSSLQRIRGGGQIADAAAAKQAAAAKMTEVQRGGDGDAKSTRELAVEILQLAIPTLAVVLAEPILTLIDTWCVCVREGVKDCELQ